MVEYQLPKLDTRVRFPSPAPEPQITQMKSTDDTDSGTDSGMMKKIVPILALIIIIALAGCATVPISPITKTKTKGIYHHVNKGETLLRIARAYNVDKEEIARANRLSDIDNISVGQLLFIPGTSGSLNKNTFRPTYKKESFVWPLRGRICSFYDASRDQIKNKGIDIIARKNTVIVAAKSGKVSFVSDNLKGYGKVIIIDHLRDYQTVYAYNSENLVTAGQYVMRDEPIAKVGSSGRAKFPCLHFEIRKGHRAYDPLHYLP